MQWYHKFKYLFLSVLFIFASVNFTKATLDLFKNKNRIEDVKSEVVALKDKKSVLEESIEYKNTPEFIEESARNDLNLVKPGESVFVVNEAIYDTHVSGSSGNLSTSSAVINAKNEVKSNFELWLDFLLKK